MSDVQDIRGTLIEYGRRLDDYMLRPRRMYRVV